MDFHLGHFAHAGCWKRGPLKATGYNGGKSSASFQNGFAESYLFCCCWLGLFYCNIIKLKLCFCYLRKKEELRSLLEAADGQTCSPVMYEKSPQRESRLLLELVGFGQHFSHPPVAFIFCKRNELWYSCYVAFMGPLNLCFLWPSFLAFSAQLHLPMHIEFVSLSSCWHLGPSPHRKMASDPREIKSFEAGFWVKLWRRLSHTETPCSHGNDLPSHCCLKCSYWAMPALFEFSMANFMVRIPWWRLPANMVRPFPGR